MQDRQRTAIPNGTQRQTERGRRACACKRLTLIQRACNRRFRSVAFVGVSRAPLAVLVFLPPSELRPQADAAPTPARQFDHEVSHGVSGRTLIKSTCKLCTASQIVSTHDGSLQVWEDRHTCRAEEKLARAKKHSSQ